MKRLALLLTATCACAHTEHYDQPGRTIDDIKIQGLTGSMEAGWFNRYLLEGREAFGESGVFTSLVSVSYETFAFEVWSGFSDSSADRELEVGLLHTFPNAPLNLTFGLSYITDMRGGNDDVDLSAGVGEELFGIEWTATTIYGTSQGGAYLETGISRSCEFAGFPSTVGGHIGSNFGYVEEGHEGLDHFAASLEISREFAGDLTLNLALSHYTPIGSDGQNHPDDEDLFRGFHFGITAEYTF